MEELPGSTNLPGAHLHQENLTTRLRAACWESNAELTSSPDMASASRRPVPFLSEGYIFLRSRAPGLGEGH